MEIQKILLKNADSGYAEFHSKLIPDIDTNTIIGIRVPIIRKIVKDYIKNDEHFDFLKALPHKYYDENMLHGILISEIKDFNVCINEAERFLPYIDNWAVCDTLRPKIFNKHKQELLSRIKVWTKSKEIYTCRFGIGMLMCHFLDDDFCKDYLKIPASIKSNEYYINMMIAWFFATALAKQWDSTITYLENDKLDAWVHNKTIQKARESFRITKEQKTYLNTLKRK